MMLRAGDWIEVRSKEEILATLDKNGCFEQLPFMPQLLRYCGKQFRVFKRADKTCDTVSGRYVGLRLTNTVHLEHRCDGEAYGGCQAGCLIFWKEAWLRPLCEAPPSCPYPRIEARPGASNCTEKDVWKATQIEPMGKVVRYSCQATRLLDYTRPLKWWDARQYVQAYRSGNVSLSELTRGLIYLLYFVGTLARSERYGNASRWLYDRFQIIWRGLPFPGRSGTIPVGQLTPRHDLNLAPGDLVRMKSYDQIRATLDTTSKNRGLSFDAEFVPYCGRIFRVRTRVERFVDEKTGIMRTLITPAIILDGVYCKSQFAGQRMFCPRSIYLWCREIWLERVSQSDVPEADKVNARNNRVLLTTAPAASQSRELCT